MSDSYQRRRVRFDILYDRSSNFIKTMARLQRQRNYKSSSTSSKILHSQDHGIEEESKRHYIRRVSIYNYNAYSSNGYIHDGVPSSTSSRDRLPVLTNARSFKKETFTKQDLRNKESSSKPIMTTKRNEIFKNHPLL